MNVRLTIALVVVLLAGMAVLVLVGDPPPENTGPTGLWPEYAAADVSAVSWGASTGPVEVRRVPGSADGWEVKAGSAWVPAEADRVEEVLNEIGRTEVLRREAGDTVDAGLREKWGLAPPHRTVTFTMRGEVVRLFLGNAALGRDAIYAGRDGTDDAFVISDDLEETLVETPVEELRRRKIFRWRVAEVDRVEVRRGGELTFAAARAKDNRFFWWAETPWTGWVSDRLEQDLLPAVLRLEASAFVSDDADVVELGKCGLVDPAWSVTLFRGEGDSRTIEIGSPVEGEEHHVHFRVADQPFVYSGKAANLLEQLGKDPDGLRDRNLTRLGWAPLGRVRGELGDTVFVLSRDEDVWTIAQPEGMTADAVAVEDWFTALLKFEVREFVDDPDLAALGLQEPAGRLTLWRPAPEGEDLGEVAVTIHIGKRTDGGVYARRTTDDEKVFIADESLLDLLAPGAWQFRSKQVFRTRPGTETPTRMERTGVLGEDATEFADGAWSNDAETARVTALINDLFAAGALRWVGSASEADGRYGLSGTAAGTLTVTFGSGQAARRYGLRLGKETEGGRFARAVRDGKPGEGVFVIATSAVDLLAGSLKKEPK